jgi:hypothetical protein
VRWRPTHLSQNQSGAVDRSRADRLRVPADTEKQGRQTDQRRQRTPTTRRDSQLARSRSATQRGPETCLCANAVLIADILEPDADVCASRSRAPRTRHAGRWRSDRVGGILE